MNTTAIAPAEALPTTLDLTGLPAEVVKQVVEIAAAAREGRPSKYISTDAYVVKRPKLTHEEFLGQLAKMAAMGANDPPLPEDWSRADLYDDHD